MRTGSPVILVLHGPTFPTLRLRRPLASLPFRALVESVAFDVPEMIVAIDSASVRYVSKRNPKARLTRIALPVDSKHFAPQDRAKAREKWGVEDRPTLLYVGRLAPEKNPGLAIDVFRAILVSIPKACLITAGTGPLERMLRDAQREYGTDRVRVAGAVPRAQLPSLYSAADAVLLTSRIEQLPSVLLESLSCGTQVISTNVGDVRLVLNNPVLGAVCDSNAESFARALSTRFPENDVDRAKYGLLRRSAAEPYSWDRLGPQFKGVIDEASAA